MKYSTGVRLKRVEMCYFDKCNQVNPISYISHVIYHAKGQVASYKTLDSAAVQKRTQNLKMEIK